MLFDVQLVHKQSLYHAKELYFSQVSPLILYSSLTDITLTHHTLHASLSPTLIRSYPPPHTHTYLTLHLLLAHTTHILTHYTPSLNYTNLTPHKLHSSSHTLQSPLLHTTLTPYVALIHTAITTQDDKQVPDCRTSFYFIKHFLK